MKVLVACEESQAVTKEFRRLGHEAYSCDIIECSGGHPEWHIMQDVLPLVDGNCEFVSMDGQTHKIEGKWDLIIAHPPCTRLCTTSQRWLYFGDKEYRQKKISEQQKAIVFFMRIILADCPRIVVENPQGIMSTAYRKPDCVYNPYDFEGETEQKKTCLWVKGVAPLKPTRKVPLPKSEITQGIFRSHFDGKVIGWNDPECARLRSQTPRGGCKSYGRTMGVSTMETYERYTLYAPGGDITFVMQDTCVDGKCKSTEVIGFHYGEPDENSIEWYSGKLKAEFCDD